MSDTSKEKPKPVVTEEMERQIIFGGALMKGTKLNISSESLPSRKSEEKSEKSSPTDDRYDRLVKYKHFNVILKRVVTDFEVKPTTTKTSPVAKL